MSTGSELGIGDIDLRDREVVPGIFVPTPDSDQAVREDAQEELQRKAAEANNEPDASCDDSLSEGLNPETLGSYRGVRQWVMCRAWAYHKDEGISCARAVEKAWGDVDKARA